MSNLRSGVVSLVLLAALCGCNRAGSSESSGSSGSGAPSARESASAAAAPSTGCPEGAFRDEAAGFCVVLPAGFAKDRQEETAKGTRLDFKGPSYGYFSVTVHNDAGRLQAQKEFINAAKSKPSDPTNVVSDTQTPPQGDGAYRTINFRGGPTSQLDYVVLNGGRLLECYSNTSKEKIDAIIETCKTLRGLSK